MKASKVTERIAQRNGKRIAKLLKEVVEACRAEGLDKPKLFFEPESMAIFVMDGDHPNEDSDRSSGMAERQEAVVARIPVVVDCPFDAGAW